MNEAWDRVCEAFGVEATRDPFGGGAAEWETVEFLMALVRCYKPRLVLETGTYHGGTTRELAIACLNNGFGHVITIESDPHRAARVAAVFAGVPAVEVVHNNSLTYLREYAGEPFGLAFLDSHIPVRPHELWLLRDRGLCRGPVVCHDTARRETKEERAYIAALDALGLPFVECPGGRGWRMFDLSR